jgi:zinc protease
VIRLDDESPGKLADKAFEKALFLDTPYGHQVEGTIPSVAGLTRDKLKEFYGRYYRPNNAILAVTGDITPDEVKSRLLPSLIKWEAAAVPKAPTEVQYGEGPKTQRMEKSITQANIIIGNKGLRRADPDYYAATVMNYILGGGGFSSRLMEDIRNRKGLAYSVASEFDAGILPGSFRITLQTKNASAPEAVAIALKEMERIQKEPVSGEELENAKRYLIGSFPMRLDSQAKLVQFLVSVEFYGLGLDYPEKFPALVRAVSREDVMRVAKRYLDPKRPIIIIVGNLKEAGF